MGWLLRDERKMRLHRPPAQHHEPPLGWSKQYINRIVITPNGISVTYRYEQACGDCGWTPEGGWEACSEHEGAEEPR